LKIRNIIVDVVAAIIVEQVWPPRFKVKDLSQQLSSTPQIIFVYIGIGNLFR
jgi:hypothetical protein